MSVPTYDEILENVADKVYLYAPKTLPKDQEAFAQDIMDALAEAYHIGSLHTATLLTRGTPPPPNPYERPRNV